MILSSNYGNDIFKEKEKNHNDSPLSLKWVFFFFFNSLYEDDAWSLNELLKFHSKGE